MGDGVAAAVRSVRLRGDCVVTTSPFRNKHAPLLGWCVDPQIYRKAAPFIEWTKLPGNLHMTRTALLHEMNLDSTPLGPVFMEFSALSELDRRGLLLPLDDERIRSRLGHYDPRILGLCAPNGIRVALPDDLDVYGLACRRGLYGPPSSWGDLQAAARRSHLRHAVAVQQQGMVNRYGFILALLISNGILLAESVDGMAGDGRRLGECLAWLQSLLRGKGGVDPFSMAHRLSHDSVVDFRAGLPFWVGWSSKIAPVAARDRRIVFAPFPKGPSQEQEATLVRGSAWCIPRNTRNPERAIEALLAVQAPVVVRRLEVGGASRKFTAWPSLWTHPDLVRRNPFYRNLPVLLRGKLVTTDLGDDRWQLLGESLYQAAIETEDVTKLRERLRGRISGGSRRPHTAVRQAIELIDRQPDKVLTIREIADRIGVHRDHLNRLIRREMKETAGAYLRRRRMERARALLQTTEDSVKAIAAGLGFCSASHFCYAFRRYWGIPATVCRKDGKT